MKRLKYVICFLKSRPYFMENDGSENIMEITAVEFEGKLIIVKNNQQIEITPFQTQEYGTIKLGITAPKGVGVDREEIFNLKQKKQQPLATENRSDDPCNPKTQSLFKLLGTIPCNVQKLEQAAKHLFDKEKTLKPKTIQAIGQGKGSPATWTVACVIDILIRERKDLLNDILTPHDFGRLWARPLLRSAISYEELLKKAQSLNMPEVLEKIEFHRC